MQKVYNSAEDIINGPIKISRCYTTDITHITRRNDPCNLFYRYIVSISILGIVPNILIIDVINMWKTRSKFTSAIGRLHSPRRAFE